MQKYRVKFLQWYPSKIWKFLKISKEIFLKPNFFSSSFKIVHFRFSCFINIYIQNVKKSCSKSLCPLAGGGGVKALADAAKKAGYF